MIVLVTGSRSWRHPSLIRERLAKLPPGSSIIHGGARGADMLAATTARALGIPETAYPADWRGRGRSAGIVRNLQMLDKRPDLVLAFWDGASTGTKHTIDAARERDIPVEIVTVA